MIKIWINSVCSDLRSTNNRYRSKLLEGDSVHTLDPVLEFLLDDLLELINANLAVVLNDDAHPQLLHAVGNVDGVVGLVDLELGDFFDVHNVLCQFIEIAFLIVDLDVKDDHGLSRGLHLLLGLLQGGLLLLFGEHLSGFAIITVVTVTEEIDIIIIFLGLLLRGGLLGRSSLLLWGHNSASTHELLPGVDDVGAEDADNSVPVVVEREFRLGGWDSGESEEDVGVLGTWDPSSVRT